VNLVTGGQKAEYDQMGIWPGDEHYTRRYDHLGEYVTPSYSPPGAFVTRTAV
jgi:pyrimidine oxygenase